MCEAHLCEAPSGPFRQMGTVPFFRGLVSGLREDGFVRAIFDGRLVNLDTMETAGGVSPAATARISEAGERPSPLAPLPKGEGSKDVPSSPTPRPSPPAFYAVVDRLVAGSASDSRLRDSLETAFTKGRGRCYAFVEIEEENTNGIALTPGPSPEG